jgi:hypothetical protein
MLASHVSHGSHCGTHWPSVNSSHTSQAAHERHASRAASQTSHVPHCAKHSPVLGSQVSHERQGGQGSDACRALVNDG